MAGSKKSDRAAPGTSNTWIAVYINILLVGIGLTIFGKIYHTTESTDTSWLPMLIGGGLISLAVVFTGYALYMRWKAAKEKENASSSAVKAAEEKEIASPDAVTGKGYVNVLSV